MSVLVKCQVYWGLTHNVVFCRYSDLISHTEKQWHTAHSGASRLTQLYKSYLHHLLCAHSSYVYYNEWIIHWYQKFTFFSKVFSFQKLFTCKSHVCWLDAIKLGSCQTQIILIEMVETNSTHTHTINTHRKITLEKVSMKISDTPLF